jgi:hypothetical protein
MAYSGQAKQNDLEHTLIGLLRLLKSIYLLRSPRRESGAARVNPCSRQGLLNPGWRFAQVGTPISHRISWPVRASHANHGVSSDAITRDTQQNAPNDRTAGAATSTSEPKGQELEYAARVSLDRTDMQVDEKLVKLGPGMAVTVEIKTGSRRIISYLLSPLAKYRREALRER